MVIDGSSALLGIFNHSMVIWRGGEDLEISEGLLNNRRVPYNPGASVIDLGNGLTLLQEQHMARLVAPQGFVTCNFRSYVSANAVRPITQPGIEVQDAQVRASKEKARKDEELREFVRSNDAKTKLEGEYLAETLSCTFSDGTTIKSGVLRTPGAPDLRVNFVQHGDGAGSFGGARRFMGDIDQKTGGAKLKVFDPKPDREYLGRCDRSKGE